ncbi:hypothetical protein [Nocardioides astragali]|uniref:Uncharacterized protein n=1 Tax=Nocardioides astragali TaxID=1776736 RepID=A0ABW2N0R6_9ACTN|nr:hypothetical protein [Nocardioides astragali]
MRRMIVGVTSAALLPLLLTGTTGGSASADPAPDVKRVERAYGDGAVRLEARQGVDVTFRARRGDRVMLDVRMHRIYDKSPCWGTQALVDGRGRRTAPLDPISGTRVFKVRTTGRAVLSFRGRCASGKGHTPHAAWAQLTKVRTREVQRNARTSVREPRRGYVDIAYVRVAHDGRDTLTLRAPDGSVQEIRRGRVLVGNRVVWQVAVPAMSVEAGQRYVLDYPSDYNARLTSGQVVGMAVGESGYAESLQANEHRVALDDPALTLPAEPGREHILIYEATPEDRAYVIPVGLPSQQAHLDDAHLRWGTWRRYPGGPDDDNPSLQRTIVFSDREGADPQSQQVRVRRTVRVPDLVVGGAAVTFASADPGTRFVSTIPVSAADMVRLTASNASATGPWETDVPPVSVLCDRDCYQTGLTVRPEELVADGWIHRAKSHELLFYFEPNATGSVTLQLTDIP